MLAKIIRKKILSIDEISLMILLPFHLSEAVARRPYTCNFTKKETSAQLFLCEFYEISKSTFSNRTPLVATSDSSWYLYHWLWANVVGCTSIFFQIRKTLSHGLRSNKHVMFLFLKTVIQRCLWKQLLIFL